MQIPGSSMASLADSQVVKKSAALTTKSETHRADTGIVRWDGSQAHVPPEHLSLARGHSVPQPRQRKPELFKLLKKIDEVQEEIRKLWNIILGCGVASKHVKKRVLDRLQALEKFLVLLYMATSESKDLQQSTGTPSTKGVSDVSVGNLSSSQGS